MSPHLPAARAGGSMGAGGGDGFGARARRLPGTSRRRRRNGRDGEAEPHRAVGAGAREGADARRRRPARTLAQPDVEPPLFASLDGLAGVERPVGGHAKRSGWRVSPTRQRRVALGCGGARRSSGAPSRSRLYQTSPEPASGGKRCLRRGKAVQPPASQPERKMKKERSRLPDATTRSHRLPAHQKESSIRG